MTTAQKLARYGATFALALTMVATTAPSLAFASESEDPSVAPFVLSTVNGGLQTAAAATEFGLGVGQAASGEAALAVGAAGTDLGAAAAGLGLGIPADALGAQP